MQANRCGSTTVMVRRGIFQDERKIFGDYRKLKWIDSRFAGLGLVGSRPKRSKNTTR